MNLTQNVFCVPIGITSPFEVSRVSKPRVLSVGSRRGQLHRDLDLAVRRRIRNRRRKRRIHLIAFGEINGGVHPRTTSRVLEFPRFCKFLSSIHVGIVINGDIPQKDCGIRAVCRDSFGKAGRC